jgi:hypothetical protein
MESAEFTLLLTAVISISFALGFITHGLLPNARIVNNKDRKFGAARHYIYLKMKIKDDIQGSFNCLFTAKEVADANERAEKNSEDLA